MRMWLKRAVMRSWKKILAGKHVLVLVQTKEQHATHLPGGLFQRDNITPVRKQPAPARELAVLGQGVTHCAPPVNNLGASRGKKTHLREKRLHLGGTERRGWVQAHPVLAAALPLPSKPHGQWIAIYFCFVSICIYFCFVLLAASWEC